MNIEVKDNFFPIHTFSKIIEDCQYNWKTSTGLYLLKNFEPDDPFYNKECLNFINILFHKKFELVRSLAMGFSSTSSHKHHYDMTNKTTHTAMLYINQNWKPTWNGGTYFGEESEHYVQYKPNRMVLFDVHNLKHCGSSFHPEANEFRYIIVWHLKDLNYVS